MPWVAGLGIHRRALENFNPMSHSGAFYGNFVSQRKWEVNRGKPDFRLLKTWFYDEKGSGFGATPFGLRPHRQSSAQLSAKKTAGLIVGHETHEITRK